MAPFAVVLRSIIVEASGAIAAVLRSFVTRVSMKNERCLWRVGIIPSAC
jgi:hypothetical protein